MKNRTFKKINKITKKISKMEKAEKDNDYKELLRKILNMVDDFNFKKYGEITFRYYRYKELEVDDIVVREENKE